MAGARATTPKKKGRQMKSPAPSPSKVGKTLKTAKVSKTAVAAIEEATTASDTDGLNKAELLGSPTSCSASPASDSPRKGKAGRGRKSAKASQDWSFTHVPPRQDERRKNGRYEGRNLVIWTRPRMMEKLVLHMQYELARHKIDVPWDAIAHRLHPGSSGSAIQQYLNRMRPGIVAEGHLIPPPLPKPGSRLPTDPTIRGYVREDMDGPDKTTMRPVPFTEPMDDRKFNLPDAFEIGKTGDTLPPPSAPLSKTTKTPAYGRSSKKGRVAVKEESPDPADLDSDADYDPSAKAGPRRRSSRAKPAKSYTVETMSDVDGSGTEDFAVAHAATKIEPGLPLDEAYEESHADIQTALNDDGQGRVDGDDEGDMSASDYEDNITDNMVEASDKEDEGAGENGDAVSDSDEFEPSNEIESHEDGEGHFMSTFNSTDYHFQENGNAVMFNHSAGNIGNVSLPTFPTTPTQLTSSFPSAAIAGVTGQFGHESQPFNRVQMASSPNPFFSPNTVSPATITNNTLSYLPPGTMGYYDGTFAPSDEEDNFRSMANARDNSFAQARLLQNNSVRDDRTHF